MDNLVRMTFRSDPLPGENRSGQLCTLPVTLQGLPKDSLVTDSWHTTDCLGNQNSNIVSVQQSIDLNWTEKGSLSDLSDLVLNTDELEQDYTNDDLFENAEEYQFEKEEYEDNLDSLIESEDTELSFPALDSTSCISSPSHSSSQASTVLKTFGFEKYNIPPLPCRHPPPATGIDDDILKLREILDDVLIKTRRINMSYEGKNRILFGPDNKIGANLLQLLSQDSKYRHF
ncbi:unnamed protein product [Mytilus coruscus]|uniref:Uncharacterized protein n=1 Tax=Mytilus coruscus TaxID=42192 RepID=A0A6J8CI55_MYTCO|nr:unnamed protein product [Mytilus coruscus]